MARSSSKPRPVAAEPIPSIDVRTGQIAEIDEEGRASVLFPGAVSAVRARSALDASARLGEDPQTWIGAPVLIVFEDGDLARPIVVGLIRDTLRPEPAPPEVKLDLGKERDVLVDGRRLVLDAHEEILIRCGKSTILLQRDGKVTIRGAHLISRSSGPNKIKGGSISLN